MVKIGFIGYGSMFINNLLSSKVLNSDEIVIKTEPRINWLVSKKSILKLK